MTGSGAVVFLLASWLVGEGDRRPLKVATRVEPGIHHAGEAIAVRVEVDGAIEPASIEPPRMADAEVWRLAGGGPDSSEARFVVVPLRAGTLVIPPFRAQSGPSTGSSTPTRLPIADVPASGRPASFLGGVGAFSLLAEVEPASVRAGQAVEYRLRIDGPAAWGSLRSPDLSPWAAKIPGLRVEPLKATGPDAAGPPTRTFLYRLRPTVPGRWTLPPVAVSAFDPGTRRYLTRFAPGTPIRVLDPPPLDPANIVDHAGEDPARSFLTSTRVGRPAILGLAAAVALGMATLGYRRGLGREDGPSRFALGLARRLDADWDGPEAAGRITEGLADYLLLASRRPPAALTPPEVHAAVAGLASDAALPDRARRLLEACDQARFGPGGTTGRCLVIEARGLLEDLAKIRPGRAGEKPREAVEAAKP